MLVPDNEANASLAFSNGWILAWCSGNVNLQLSLLWYTCLGENFHIFRKVISGKICVVDVFAWSSTDFSTTVASVSLLRYNGLVCDFLPKNCHDVVHPWESLICKKSVIDNFFRNAIWNEARQCICFDKLTRISSKLCQCLLLQLDCVNLQWFP